MAALEAARRALLHTAPEVRIEKGRQWRQRTGIGITAAWLLVMACFAWRALKTRREVGGWAGFTPTPSPRGERARAQGIAKSGNRQGRWMTTEWAWRWGRYQPESALRGGLKERWGGGGKRLRRIGMVAVARQFLMALWRFLETGAFPEGAVRKEAAAALRC
jgi:transposase